MPRSRFQRLDDSLRLLVAEFCGDVDVRCVSEAALLEELLPGIPSRLRIPHGAIPDGAIVASLPQDVSLRILELQDFIADSKRASELCVMVERNQGLRVLRLHGITFIQSRRGFLLALAKNTNLRELALRAMHISDEDLVTMLSGNNMMKLTKLDLEGNDMCGNTLKESLRNQTSLKSLNLSLNPLLLQRIVHAGEELRKLTAFHFDCVHQNDADLAGALQALNGIKELTLPGIVSNSHSLTEMALKSLHSMKKLTFWPARKMKVTSCWRFSFSVDVYKEAEGLEIAHSRTLISQLGGLDAMVLNLRTLKLRDVSGLRGSLITRVLSRNRINVLDLGLNVLSESFFGELARALTENRSLEILNLERTTLGANGSKFICNSLKSHRCLRILNLNANRLGNVTLHSLADLLASNDCIEEVSVERSNLFGRYASGILGRVLQSQNRSLRLLHLFGNWVGMEPSRSFLDALRKNRGLHDVAFQPQGLSEEERVEFEALRLKRFK